MKLIGHVSTAVLAATPLILHRHAVPALGAPAGDSPYPYLWWTGLWAAAPDLDIVLSRFTPIKHRGFLSHSLLTAVSVGLLVLAAALTRPLWAGEAVRALPWLAPALGRLAPLLTPLGALLAGLAVTVHLLGDAMTKTGVPLLYPDQGWHIPLVGGYAAFDNFALNLIPLLAAGAVVVHVFGYDAGLLRHLGHWR